MRNAESARSAFLVDLRNEKTERAKEKTPFEMLT